LLEKNFNNIRDPIHHGQSTLRTPLIIMTSSPLLT